ncbi:GPI-anchored surface protein, putative [Bodo saltans]|uniref:GPI-anchored surface protein, putative n=1 Tax=Bodo saltans TaxID=75058 RepID=A0A0S4J729_BODSA|nr:GPI-anchored surface protein, putative [Bodo saltans]|eukprot:CUG85728.1 GPI-anchored surface protein, putative [Bodo saltans]
MHHHSTTIIRHAAAAISAPASPLAASQAYFPSSAAAAARVRNESSCLPSSLLLSPTTTSNNVVLSSFTDGATALKTTMTSSASTTAAATTTSTPLGGGSQQFSTHLLTLRPSKILFLHFVHPLRGRLWEFLLPTQVLPVFCVGTSLLKGVTCSDSLCLNWLNCSQLPLLFCFSTSRFLLLYSFVRLLCVRCVVVFECPSPPYSISRLQLVFGGSSANRRSLARVFAFIASFFVKNIYATQPLVPRSMQQSISGVHFFSFFFLHLYYGLSFEVSC